jgi:hypothetical protein
VGLVGLLHPPADSCMIYAGRPGAGDGGGRDINVEQDASDRRQPPWQFSVAATAEFVLFNGRWQRVSARCWIERLVRLKGVGRGGGVAAAAAARRSQVFPGERLGIYRGFGRDVIKYFTAWIARRARLSCLGVETFVMGIGEAIFPPPLAPPPRTRHRRSWTAAGTRKRNK